MNRIKKNKPAVFYTLAAFVLITVLYTACTLQQGGGNGGSENPYTKGSQWTAATLSANFTNRSGHAAVVFNNLMWVIGGDVGSGYSTNDIWYSSDGTNWICASSGAAFKSRFGHVSMVFNNKMWVIGGTGNIPATNDVWYSSDGTNWTCAVSNAGFPGRYKHTGVVFKNRMWIIGGFSGGGYVRDVWCSADGTNWSCTNQSAPLSAVSLTGFCFKNRLWITGEGSSSKMECWDSDDGTNWNHTAVNGGITNRSDYAGFVYDNRMWIIGGAVPGIGFDSYTNDVWYSSDGANWTCAASAAPFSGRNSHSGIAYNNRMWIIGGNLDIGGSLTNDVWYSQ